MIKVLFVCLGNICRSPMAEAIFRHKVKEAGLDEKIEVDSAGTGHWHVGDPPHEGTQRILTQNQISFEGIKARQVTHEDFKQFDYVIAMDKQNALDLEKIAKEIEGPQVKLLLEYLPERGDLNVPDPYFTGNFEEVYDMINKSCDRLLEDIVKTNQLQSD